jgi:hypothetical protein
MESAMAEDLEATPHSAVGSIAVLTIVGPDGKEWIAGASLTRLRPKGTPPDEECVTVQLSEEEAGNWRIKEFRVVTP